MPTITQAKEKIYSTFIADWAGATPVTIDNEVFDPPVNAPYVRVVVRHRDSNQETLGGVGNRKFLREGSVIVQVFTPLNAGSKTADTHATSARAVFEGKTLTPEQVRFTDVVVREIGTSEGWFQMNVEAFFNYDETK